MAEFLMKALVREAGLEKEFSIDSAATSGEEIGNPIYPPVQRLLAQRNISCAGKTARRVTRGEYARWDCIIGMDEENRRELLRLFGGDPQHKISLLLDFTARPRSVADPWYTRDFAAAERDITEGCRALLAYLLET